MRSQLLVGGVLSISAQAFGLTIIPNYVTTGAGSWDATEQAVIAQAITDWQSVITTNVTINVNLDFTNAGTGGYLGQWSGGRNTYAGDDAYPWQKTTHTIHFNADLASGVHYLWFDPTPTTSDDQPFVAWDALSVARHELGHMLGFVPNFYKENIGTASEVNLWDRFITVNGSSAVFDQGGLNVSLASSGNLGHLLGVNGPGGDLMSTALYNGERLPISSTDLAMLSMAYNYTVVPEPGIVGFAVTTAILTLRRRKRCK